VRLFCLALLLACVATPLRATDYGKVTSKKVADGVFLFTTTPYADVGFCGNVTAVVGDDAVLLFDSGALPQTAWTILSELRKITPKPVRYLINSHWHWDHWGGNQVIAEAFPGVQIITHDKTREMMLDVEPRWNERGLKQDLPTFIADFEKRIAAMKAEHAPEERIRRAEERLAVAKDFLRQKQTLKKTLPNVTFSGRMMVQLGGGEVQILQAKAITPGDTYVYLPKEKVLITGDILLNPYPYAIGGTYPQEWEATLDKFAALQPAWIIPGHGDPVAGNTLAQSNLAMMRDTSEQVKTGKAQGRSVEELLKDVNAPAVAAKVGVTGDDALGAFRAYFLDVFVKRAYQELNGALGELPDGMQ
jgi:glyoxylase-like metal-dependent hydrolase (beta-lactamase superfamily II)